MGCHTGTRGKTISDEKRTSFYLYHKGRSTFEKAYEKLVQDQVGEDAPKKIVGPKTLNLYGAPYIWAVFLGIGLIEEAVYVQQKMDI